MLNALNQPAACLGQDGIVEATNRAFRQTVGREWAGSPFVEFVGEPAKVRRLISDALATSGPVLARFCIDGPGARRQILLRASRIAFAGGPMILAQIDDEHADRFIALNDQIALLKKEIQERLKAEAILSETVRERELLLSELHHRVKNNMHMLSALLSGAAREGRNEEARTALSDMSQRVAALGAVQQLLYRSNLTAIVDACEIVTTLAHSALALADGEIEHTIDCRSVRVKANLATSIALICNELLTNAIKYGRPPSGPQRIGVTLAADEGLVMLCVRDNGPGFEPGETRQRASGIGLVRGLLRQLGGNLEILTDNGTECCAKFSVPDEPED